MGRGLSFKSLGHFYSCKGLFLFSFEKGNWKRQKKREAHSITKEKKDKVDEVVKVLINLMALSHIGYIRGHE